MPSTPPAACSTLSTTAGLLSADYIHEQGNHGYRASYTGRRTFSRRYSTADTTINANVPSSPFSQSDNRSSYNGLMLHLQGNMRRFDLVANYTLSKAQTWGCVLGELFDYVDGVCTAQSGPNKGKLDAFGPGDTAPPAKTFAIALCSPVRCTSPADSN